MIRCYTIYINIGRGGIFIKDNNYCYFVNNGEFFYENQILSFYDLHNNYICNVKILKFIKHYHRKNKEPYICVKVQYLDGYKTHISTFNATTHLGTFFTTKNKLEEIYKKVLTNNNR